MGFTVNVINKKDELKYPILMSGPGELVKLFINETDGIVLSRDGSGALGKDCISLNGRAGEFGAPPIKATDPYWKPLNGEVILRN